MVTETPKPKRLTIQLAPETAAVLERLAKSKGVTLTEALRQAIGTEDYLYQASKRGSKVLLEEKDQLKELVFR
jgi:hypothetical protein